MNLTMKQKQTHRHRKQTCGCQEGGMIGSLGLADANIYIYIIYITHNICIIYYIYMYYICIMYMPIAYIIYI